MRVLALLLVACAAPTHYAAKITAPGELTLTYDSEFRMWSQGKLISHSYAWSGLSEFVRCVPKAQQTAKKAERSGALAVALSISGGVLGGVSLGAIPVVVTTRDYVVQWSALLIGTGIAALGAVLAGLGRTYKNAANGQAIDAMNFYNDAVGSYGASCDHPEE